jgi:RHS repeat-associated protein
MPGSDGYTGQHADAATGLDDDGARSYDPAAGQFTSADTLLAGLNRYGYVGGDPENATDPSGHLYSPNDTTAVTLERAAPTGGDGVGGGGGGGDPTLIIVAGIAAIVATVKGVAQQIHDLYNPPTTTTQAVIVPPASTPASTPGPSDNTNPLGPAINRSTPFYSTETPPSPGGGPGPSPVDGVGERDAPAGPAGDSGMGRGGQGGAPTAGSCDDGGLWLYHGSDTAIDSFKVDDAIARQQSRPWRRLENGEGIYFTDDALRAAEYSSNKVAGGVYRGWAPQDLLDRLAAEGKISRISTNNSLQYVINSQVDAEVLNQTFGRARAVDVILNGGWPESGTGC